MDEEVGRALAVRVADDAFQHEGREGEALVFEVVPDKVLSFAKEHFAATRFRF